jgi:hypothetical protein
MDDDDEDAEEVEDAHASGRSSAKALQYVTSSDISPRSTGRLLPTPAVSPTSRPPR